MSTIHPRADIRLDQQYALKVAAGQLRDEFHAAFGVETIERFLQSSYDESASRATVTAFLPLLAERSARQRLRALSKVEGLSTDVRPAVLFLCRGRSALSTLQDFDRMFGLRSEAPFGTEMLSAQTSRSGGARRDLLQ